MQARLIYVIGASGVGKDSLLNHLRDHDQHQRCFSIAKRYITRPNKACTEAHVAIDEAEFERRVAAGDFALYWRSHGFAYGIDRSIRDQLAGGMAVVVNGSREYLPEASERFPDLLPVLIRVSDGTLRQRLQGRGRDSPAEIEQRLERAHRLDAGLRHPALVKLDNDESLEVAGRRLAGIVMANAVETRS